MVLKSHQCSNTMVISWFPIHVWQVWLWSSVKWKHRAICVQAVFSNPGPLTLVENNTPNGVIFSHWVDHLPAPEFWSPGNPDVWLEMKTGLRGTWILRNHNSLSSGMTMADRRYNTAQSQPGPQTHACICYTCNPAHTPGPSPRLFESLSQWQIKSVPHPWF